MEKISPLKAKPLRQAGQSLQEEIDKIINDQALNYIVAPVFLISLTLYEWLRYSQSIIPSIKSITVLALSSIIVTLFCTLKLIKFRKNIKNMRLGRDGEKAVGQYLELLREDGCIVFHDIIGDKFNIDHVVISEKGIYCIETKTYSKPDKDEPTVHYKEGNLDIDGVGRKNEILKQVQAASTWLKETLKESTGKELPIKPVILFPGWWIETKDFNEIWVLNPKAFSKFLMNAKAHISKEDKKLVAYHISRYIRSL